MNHVKKCKYCGQRLTKDELKDVKVGDKIALIDNNWATIDGIKTVLKVYKKFLIVEVNNQIQKIDKDGNILPKAKWKSRTWYKFTPEIQQKAQIQALYKFLNELSLKINSKNYAQIKKIAEQLNKFQK